VTAGISQDRPVSKCADPCRQSLYSVAEGNILISLSDCTLSPSHSCDVYPIYSATKLKREF